MNKENSNTSIVGNFTGRLTRARAAALHSSGCGVLLKEPTVEQNQKRVSRASLKRAALDENAATTSVTVNNPQLPKKRRAVLKDVTNVVCQNSYRNCFNASKIKGKKGKQAITVATGSKGASLDSLQKVQDCSKLNMSKETVNSESRLEEVSTTLETNVTPPLDALAECGINNHRLAVRTLVSSQFQRSSRKAGKEILSGKSEICDLNYMDIDSDHTDAQLCSEYADEIYKYLRVGELKGRPLPDFMETIQRDITQSMRAILVDWLVEVSEEYKLMPDTLYLTVYLIDWFLSQNYIQRQRLQLLGITCMLIASKYEELCAPPTEEFCLITDNSYTRAEVLRMEIRVLNFFNFNLSTPTTKAFLRRYLRAAQASYTNPSLELKYLADFLAELALVDYGFLSFLPSVIAASAVFLARWTLDQSRHPWNPTLEHYTSYKPCDLKKTVLALQDLQWNTKGCPLNAIRMKYRQQKFESVASLSSPKLLDTLFLKMNDE